VKTCAMASEVKGEPAYKSGCYKPLSLLHSHAVESGGCSRGAASVWHVKHVKPHLGAAVCLQILAEARHLHLAQLILLPLHQSVHLRQTGGHDKDSSP
jgi:hypothetical protein